MHKIRNVAISLLIGALAAGSGPSMAGDGYRLRVEAFSPGGIPIGEKIAECSPLKSRCAVGFELEPDARQKAIVVSARERQPGVLLILAEQWGFTVGAARIQNEPGAAAEIKAVGEDASGKDVVLIIFQVERL